jgi:flagellar basal-body rod modification protein FlgD
MSINSTSFLPSSSFLTRLSALNGSAVGSVGGTNSVDTISQSGSNSVYGLTTDDFMKLFLAQLQNQDPTKPMDDTQMLAELSQMTQIQTLQQVQKALQGSQLAQSSALIGKNVTGMDVNGAAVNGVVTSVTQSTDAGLVLQVGSQFIKPDSVITVTAPTGTNP